MPTNPIKASLDTSGNQIRLGRLALRWTQEELAERSGVNRVTVAYVEGGKVEKARVGTMRALARTLEDAGVEFTVTGIVVQGPLASRPAPDEPEPIPAFVQMPDSQEDLRRRLAARIGRTKNLAEPAREIGVTSQTLKGFLAGGRAYDKTVAKIEKYLAT